MKPDKNRPDNNRRPLNNSDLEKIGRRTLGKNMRNLEDIMADYIAGVELDVDEEKLLDRQVHEKTGKHIDKYKPKPPKPKFKGMVISRDGDAKGQMDSKPVDTKPPKEPETSSKVVTKAGVV